MNSSASNRVNKRTRDAREGGSSHVTIPFGDDKYRSVDAREGKLLKHGPHGGFMTTDPRSTTKIELNEAWNNATEWELLDDSKFALDPDEALYLQALNADIMEEDPQCLPNDEEKKKKQRSNVSKRPHRVWKETRRSCYLDEILQGAGCADFTQMKECPDCVSSKKQDIGAALYRCSSECFLQDLTCKLCCVRRHRRLPFHRVEKWTGSSFVPVSLSSLGLKIVLNHSSLYCAAPIPCHQSLLIFHTNGIHECNIHYCGCGQGEPQHIQLLRRQLYPASQLIIKTCVTFELLDHLHKLSLTTKSSLYDFYRGLERLTDNTGLQKSPSVTESFSDGEAEDTIQGVQMRPSRESWQSSASCPIPGVNMMEGRRFSPEKWFLNTAFVCMDANFRLKNRLVSNYDQSPGLGMGWAYLVEREPYERYILNRANDADVSSCVGFQAMAQANTRFSTGLRYTGVGGVFCARSEMVMPQGMGSLVKGERYSNMDYIFGSAVQGFKNLPAILISYDISCQWSINLAKRMSEDDWPAAFAIPPSTRIIPAVPKLHEAAHETANHQVFSLHIRKRPLGLKEPDSSLGLPRARRALRALKAFRSTQGALHSKEHHRLQYQVTPRHPKDALGCSGDTLC
ncbi:hypothetical protein BJ165DRAFT_1535856 [Panaeolus papilionaceus]|nr:hypothetical protein BJ165DRAFT_1535856 [Panaeolus papilionaceus]